MYDYYTDERVEGRMSLALIDACLEHPYFADARCVGGEWVHVPYWDVERLVRAGASVRTVRLEVLP